MSNEQVTESLKAELSRHQGDLLPGAIDALAERWSNDIARHANVPGKLAREIQERLSRPENARYFKPGREKAEVADPLEHVLKRYSKELKPDAAGRLYDAWALTLARKDLPEVVEEVSRRLADPSNNQYLKTPNPPEWRTANVLKALEAFGPQLNYGAAEDLAGRWGAELGTMAPRDIVQQVAAKLKSGAYDAYLADGKFSAAQVPREPEREREGPKPNLESITFRPGRQERMPRTESHKPFRFS